MALINDDRLKQVMNEEGLDILIATSIENIQYSTDYRSFSKELIKGVEFFSIIPKEGLAPRVLIAPNSEMDLISENYPKVDKIIPYGMFSFTPPTGEKITLEESDKRLVELGVPQPKHATAVEALLKYLSSYDLSELRIGIDESGIGITTFNRVLESLQAAEIIHASSIWTKIRMVKTKEEIARLRKAVSVTEAALMATFDVLKEGIMEREVAVVFNRSVIEQGASPSFSVIAFGSHSAYPNAAITERKLRKGDVIRYDVGCTYGGYHSDMSRTAIFGNPSQKTKDYYSAILKGEEALINELRPGRRPEELFKVAVEATRRSGISEYARNHVGHGIGIEIYDPPILKLGNKTIIEEGMVFCVETPFYEIGWMGLQIEDEVIVTTDGAAYLTRMSRELIVI